MWTKTNKTLLIILVITTLALIIDITTSRSHKDSFRQQLIEADTSQIGKIVFYPKGDETGKITILRDNDAWAVQTGNKKYPADKDKVRSMIETLTNLRPTQVVANNHKQWAEYGVADTNSLNIIVYNTKGKQIAHLYVGKIKTEQAQMQYAYPGQNQSYYTYVRLDGDKNVYLVPQLLALTFINDPNAYRDQTIINIQQFDIQSITINDSQGSFTIKRDGNTWIINDQIADSLQMMYYLRDISHIQGWQFAPESIVAGLKTLKTLTLDLASGKQIQVKGMGDTAITVIWSSQNPQTYFKAAALPSRLFKTKDYFLNKQEAQE